MRCPIETRETAELLLAYSARKLDSESAAGLERHMEICQSCREFAEGQRLVWEALDAWEAIPVSADFNRRLYARIDREVSWWERAMRPFRPMLVRGGLPVAATACLLVMAGFLLDRPRDVPGNPDWEPAQIEAVQADQVENALEDMELLRDFQLEVRADASRTSM
jgi:hypothetical protein